MEFARLKNFQLHSNRLNGTLAVELDLLEEGLVFFVERRKKVKMKENVDVESMVRFQNSSSKKKQMIVFIYGNMFPHKPQFECTKKGIELESCPA
ncbi:hypothetical protein B9Z55_026342 [Caenorhabditis nigoni]|uniref:Uncharacterized protein n=1 Tax=Caenorhabditis nigoni TaxID=1611254 RepID=A0A2G5T2R6_9PELO|nr:hypothetical protein B9Z55_026342 [Caenorhabditis nigoni]